MLELSNQADIKRLEKIARLFIEKFWDNFTEDEKQKITEWTGIQEVE